MASSYPRAIEISNRKERRDVETLSRIAFELVLFLSCSAEERTISQTTTRHGGSEQVSESAVEVAPAPPLHTGVGDSNPSPPT
jgi:hypothetical protein